ncbi:hypothetical protein [Nocardia sp. NBC_01377]|uniref:hypothetical protein n=1 Tax=Nocardia sp. NBC_01377 TaxID=2903595 RepID=UPI003865D94D
MAGEVTSGVPGFDVTSGAVSTGEPALVVRGVVGLAEDVAALPVEVPPAVDVPESVPHAATPITTLAAIDNTADNLTFISHPSKPVGFL